MLRRKPIDPERSADLPVHRLIRTCSRLSERILLGGKRIPEWQYRRARYHRPGSYEWLDSAWGAIKLGESWGGQDVTGFFRCEVEFPRKKEGRDFALNMDLDGGEALLTIDNNPIQGLDWNRRIVPIPESFLDGGRHILEIEAYVINYPYDERRADERFDHLFRESAICEIDRPLEAFLRDFRFAIDYVSWLWETDGDRQLESYLLAQCEKVAACIGPVDQLGASDECMLEAHRMLRRNIYETPYFRFPQRISVCAHSHLDLVYLWPLKETVRKNVRTVTNALSLMREFPKYRFSWSQPWLYEQLETTHPEVFREVSERVREGRWEPIGAMYVEPDGNLLGAESIVRQILFGQRYFQEKFGMYSPVCWLPDVFGVIHTMPQILKKGRIDYFLTVKLTIWNDTNDFPYNTFRWRGPDGSEVIAHFPPSHFGQGFTAANLRQHWETIREPNKGNESLYVYGPADGGGGPTREMVDASCESTGIAGLPTVRLEHAADFFRRQDSIRGQLPVWDSELYLETHRGTYTTRAILKQKNRQLESLYRITEFVGSLARFLGGASFQKDLNEGWKALLLNQFHDTLPGTHVPEAHDQIEETNNYAEHIARTVLHRAGNWIFARVNAPGIVDGHTAIIFNSLSWNRNVIVKVALGELKEHSSGVEWWLACGKKLSSQIEGQWVYVRVENVPSCGWVTLFYGCPDEGGDRGVEDAKWYSLDDGQKNIETPWYNISFNQEGRIERLYDRSVGRDVLCGPGNDFQVFEDDPGVKFSAWDIPTHAFDHKYPVTLDSSWRCVNHGPLFVTMEAKWSVLNSEIVQCMRLYRHSGRIDFLSNVSWRDSRKLLKVAFPLAVRSRRAVCHMPFGLTERSTHRNTSWEQAKYEVPVHYWMDLSEANYGVAVLNNCKYGYDVIDNLVRISLLRSPVRPDATSDIGEHSFAYALFPHEGSTEDADVHREGYEFNHPVHMVVKESKEDQAEIDSLEAGERFLPATYSLLEPSSRGVVVEAVKEAEDGPGIVIRSYEALGGRAAGSFHGPLAVIPAQETDLLEKSCTSNAIDGPLREQRPYTPFEIRTHMVNIGMNTKRSE
ncbi:alpha-mannosidase [Alkalispirochaeta alkalica]|uniref:alpha-mannosidase n=1 Tax=Alkalispirochaeta alkalica TaxID=46356 RepID=UPI0003AB14B6|nr:glycoside hydrolase family 38 C-terminal domain-containing protein [Alkalispirochaeta alkalica]